MSPLYDIRPQGQKKTVVLASAETLEIFARDTLTSILADNGLNEIILSSIDGGPDIVARPNYPDGGIGRGIIKALYQFYEDIAADTKTEEPVISISCCNGLIIFWPDRNSYDKGAPGAVVLASLSK